MSTETPEIGGAAEIRKRILANWDLAATPVIEFEKRSAPIERSTFLPSLLVGERVFSPLEGVAALSQADIYPHAFDESSPGGAARSELKAALTRLDLATDAYSEGDFAGIATRLAETAVALKAAYSKLHRDDPLAALVGYMKRATLSAVPQDLTRAALEAIRSVLRGLIAGPVLSLSDAADYSDRLEQTGWDGDEPNVSALLQALLGEEVLETGAAAAVSSEPHA